MDTISIIDCGTNAIRHVVFNFGPGPKQVEQLHFARSAHSIASEVYESGAIGDQNRNWLIGQLKEFIQFTNKSFGVPTYIFATSIFRDATNKETLLTELSKTSIVFHIIDGDTEAIAATTAAQYAAGVSNAVCVDIGGGSTELGLISDNKIDVTQSIDIGSARLYNSGQSAEFFLGPVNLAKFSDGATNIKPPVLVGLGGSAKAIELAGTSLGIWQQSPFQFRDLLKLQSKIISMDDELLIQLAKVDPSRTNTIGPAIDILVTLMSHYDIGSFIVPVASTAMGLGLLVRDQKLPTS